MDLNILTTLNDNIRIDPDKCTACGRCVEVCVLDNLRLQLSPCRQACPVGMNCQGYIHHLGKGKPDKGLEMIHEAVPFGGILGRICSRPCEAVCNRSKVDGQAVAIRDLKRYLDDQNGDPWIPPVAEERSQKVAVVGGGREAIGYSYRDVAQPVSGQVRHLEAQDQRPGREPPPCGPEMAVPLST